MTNERFNKKMIELKALIPSDHFRTVESFEMRKAKTEINVEIELKDNFIQNLKFKVPWDGKLYAYARNTDELVKLCSEKNITVEEIKTIYFEDWDDKFSIIVETKDRRKEISYYVSVEDVKELLENCCRIASQK